MKLDDMDKRLVAFEMKAAGPQTAPEIWKEAKAAYDKGSYEDARNLFKRLVVKFPQDSNADDAQYYRGESSA
jgi:TolA-binding protein